MINPVLIGQGTNREGHEFIRLHSFLHRVCVECPIGTVLVPGLMVVGDRQEKEHKQVNLGSGDRVKLVALINDGGLTQTQWSGKTSLRR